MSNIKVVDYNTKRSEFELYHKFGGANMNYAGFECLNGIFQFADDGVTDITGHPASGKTEFGLELLFFQAEKFGKRFILYAPDIGSYKEIRRKLLVKHYKRSFRGYENSLTESDLIHASAWIDTYFLIVTKDDPKLPITPTMIWDFTSDFEDVNGPVDGCFIDSWKNLFHDFSQFNGREDLYLDYTLSYRNELAELKGKHFMTIEHPLKTEFLKTSDGQKRRVPDALDISGGPAWFRNGKVIITVDYPDKSRSDVDLYFSKVKPDTIGKMNVVMQKLEFDWKKSRYRETIEGSICYAGEGKKKREQGEFIGFAGENNNDLTIPF
jgi:hypothetical protein